MDLLPLLTCRLLTASSYAWRQLTDADVDARLPSPALHGAALGGVITVLTMLGAMIGLRPNLHFSDAVRAALAAIGSSVGASALALLVVPAWLRGLHVAQKPALRYASTTALPLAVSGGCVLLPHLATSLIAIALLGALAYLSGLRGAAMFLSLQGSEKTRAAALASLAPTLPALLLAPLHAVR
ncbi:MAG TPA: hypothetical protein VFN67_04520 [Polyangiales bacterium]|jgi:hypothetical protein|nr:hypothetical protein [Polyangiales bacterium]